MAGETVIKPDLQFVNQVIASGGDTVKKCYQCDTCSVVCNPTPDAKPFPRKEMLQAQWGQKSVLKDPDIWLCHQCSDCTVYCPRGAKPGEVMNALRKMCIQEYATPPQLAKMVGDSRYLLALIAFPVLLLLGVLKFLGTLGVNVGEHGEKLIHQGFAIPEGTIRFSKLFPTLLGIDFVFVPAMFFAVAVLALGVMRYWKDINEASPFKTKVEGNLVGNLIATLQDILMHNRFRLCETTYPRSTNHLFVLAGFIFLAIVTGWGFLNEWVLHHESPYFLFSPIKLMAMVGTAALLYGIYNIIKSRQANAEKAGLGGYYDWLFIYVVFAVGATGLLSWVFRLVGIRILAYPTYFLHLTSVFFLFFYAPYTKMAHMVYRTAAMLYARMSGRGF
ncbi:MAG: quinone-interacting membrane-bound oxidoreductase complex subunit QmoC [Desulfobaccales bacterium]